MSEIMCTPTKARAPEARVRVVGISRVPFHGDDGPAIGAAAPGDAHAGVSRFAQVRAGGILALRERWGGEHQTRECAKNDCLHRCLPGGRPRGRPRKVTTPETIFKGGPHTSP